MGQHQCDDDDDRTTSSQTTGLSDRLRTNSFGDAHLYAGTGRSFRRIGFRLDGASGPGPKGGLLRTVDPHPFVPKQSAELHDRCREIFRTQVTGLAKRLEHIGLPKPTMPVVIGVSGGLDSTHALIVAARAMDRLGRPRSDILAYTLPGFATGG